MPNSIMYEEDYFVVLETNQPEQIISVSELHEKLKATLMKLNSENLPNELRQFDTVEAQVKHLIDTSCELNLGPSEYLQWYAVRLEK